MSEPISPSTSQPLVLREHVGAVARIVLNRPSARNALSRALCNELLQTLAVVHAMAEAGEVRAATLHGAGPAFCGGADLKERATLDAEGMSAHSHIIASCAERLAALACPVIACINGAALGGGIELALACDLRVVAADATLGFPELNYGFFPGAGGPVRLARLVGISTATYLIMSTARISGEEAVRLHVGNVLAPPRGADQDGLALAEKIAALPPKGVAALRTLLASLDGEQFSASMARARVLRERLNDDEVRKAVAGFGQRP